MRRLLAALVGLGLWASPARSAELLAQVPAVAPAPEAGPLERSFDLDSAIASALKNDSRLLSAEQDRIIAEQRLTEAKLAFLPEFGLQASAVKFDARYPMAFTSDLGGVLAFPRGSAFNPTGSENIFSGRGYMSFPVYEGGRSVNTLRLAQAAQAQAQSNYESVRLEVVLAVKEAFYRLLLAQERSAATSEAQSEAQRQAAGLRPGPWEAVEAAGLTEKARQWAAQAARELTLRRLDFLKTLNLEAGTPFHVVGRLEPQPVSVDPQNAALRAMELRPELRSESYKAAMDAIAVNLALSRRYPTLFLAGDYDFTDQHFPLLNNNWDVGIGLKIPLTYDFLTKLRQRRAEQRQGQLKRASLQDQVRLEVRQACEQLGYWKGEVGLRGQEHRAVSELYDQAAPAAAASLGKLRALLTVIEMRLSYLEAAAELTLARARLERAMGQDLAP